MVIELIKKDWYFAKRNTLLLFFLGLASVFLLTFNNRLFYLGLVLLLSIIILIGALLITSTVVNERKNHTLAFLMSLPITYMDFTKAKMILNLSVFSLVWIILVMATIGVINYSEHLPNGLMPYASIILIELFVAFILILATALVTESETWTIIVMSITNIAVSLFMFLIASISSIKQHMESPMAVWNSTALMIIAIEIIVGLFIIGLTLYLQSRKKDFT
jgi:hypothetical protein